MSLGASERVLGSVQVDGEYTDNMRTLRDNMATLQGKLLGQAAQVLGYATLGADQTIGTSAYTLMTGMEVGITTSGGLLVLVGQVTAGITEGQAQARITLDGEVKASIKPAGAQNVTGVVGAGSALAFWAGTVEAGKHTLRLEGLGVGASMTAVGGNGFTSLWAIEFLV